MFKIFIIVPSFQPTGPIKGAVALANGLVDFYDVCFIPLKDDNICSTFYLRKSIDVFSVSLDKGYRKKISRIKKKYESIKDYKVISISLCFSADFVNSFLSSNSITISSIRANNILNYKFDYGYKGLFLAYFHYFLLRRFDSVIAMSNEMAIQLKTFGIKKIQIIGNFVDEIMLSNYLDYNLNYKGFRFLFLGSLTKRKNPCLLIEQIIKLNKDGTNCYLDIVGDGPLLDCIREKIKRNKIQNRVKIHGYIKNPYVLIQKVDCMVLPSFSEGISRAALESLFFGVPVIARDIDANREVIIEGKNGLLFKKDEDLLNKMNKIMLIQRKKRNLIPLQFKQKNCINQFIKLIKENE